MAAVVVVAGKPLLWALKLLAGLSTCLSFLLVTGDTVVVAVVSVSYSIHLLMWRQLELATAMKVAVLLPVTLMPRTPPMLNARIAGVAGPSIADRMVVLARIRLPRLPFPPAYLR